MCRPGQGSPTWPLSPTPTRSQDSAGGSLHDGLTSMVLDAIERYSGPANKKAHFDLKDVIHHTDRDLSTSIRFSEASPQRQAASNRRSERSEAPATMH